MQSTADDDEKQTVMRHGIMSNTKTRFLKSNNNTNVLSDAQKQKWNCLHITMTKLKAMTNLQHLSVRL